MKNKLKRYALRAFAIGTICGVCFLIGQVATYTTFAQLPAVSAGGTFNLLSDSLAMAFNADSSGTRNWFIRPVSITPITTANWTTLGSGGTRTNGTNYISLVGSVGATPNIFGVSRTVGAGDFSHTLVVYSAIPNSSPANFTIGFTDGTKTEGCGTTANGTATIPNPVAAVASTALASGSYSTPPGGLSIAPAIGGNLSIIKLTRVNAVLSALESFDGGVTFPLTCFSDTVPFLGATALYVAVDPRTSSSSAVGGSVTFISSTLQ